MKSVITIFTILAIFGTTSGTLQYNYSHPDYPNRCHVSPGLVLDEGEAIMFPWLYCANLLCQREGMAVVATCDDHLNFMSKIDEDVREKKDCYLGDFLFPNHPFPKCCNRRVECPLMTDPQTFKVEALY